MCGIACIFELQQDPEKLRPVALKMARRLRHRGPDWSGIHVGAGGILAHERLAIVDPTSGGQPLRSRDGQLVLAVNGEIYNHREIRQRLQDYDFQTGSDCEVILALYREVGVDFLEELSGIFAFALYDQQNDRYLVARDHMGIIPLYTGRDPQGNFYVASELKALEGVCKTIEVFPPGHLLDSREGTPRPWYRRPWTDFEEVRDSLVGPAELRATLEGAVHRQLMSDVPYGVLLSGGLDSSMVSAIARRPGVWPSTSTAYTTRSISPFRREWMPFWTSSTTWRPTT